MLNETLRVRGTKPRTRISLVLEGDQDTHCRSALCTQSIELRSHVLQSSLPSSKKFPTDKTLVYLSENIVYRPFLLPVIHRQEKKKKDIKQYLHTYKHILVSNGKWYHQRSLDSALLPTFAPTPSPIPLAIHLANPWPADPHSHQTISLPTALFPLPPP